MKLISKILILSLCGIFAGCNKPAKNEDQDSVVTEIPELDTAASIVDTVATVPVDTLAADKSTEGEYPDGILPVIREEAPEYYEKLKQQGNEGFIIVDKARMKVLLYDGDGYAKRVYGMACAKNYGTKRQKADSRTPEGYFNVQGVYDSTDWLYTDDNGKTSKKKRAVRPSVHTYRASDRNPWNVRALVDRSPSVAWLYKDYKREYNGTSSVGACRYAGDSPARKERPCGEPGGG